MFQHVRGQQLVIKCREWRSYCKPGQEQANHKTTGAPTWNTIQAIASKRNPSANVHKGREHERDGDQQWPKRSRCAVMKMWHRTIPYGCKPDWFSSLSATSREASRAGACPFGCSVSRKATRAVV